MAGISLEVLLGGVVLLLLAAAVLMLVMVVQLRAMRREVEATRIQLAKMDWSVMLFNGVQQLKQAIVALEQIDKRLQKLEALEKVQLSHIKVGPVA
jgi:sensor domain CHASE-containing protein